VQITKELEAGQTLWGGTSNDTYEAVLLNGKWDWWEYVLIRAPTKDYFEQIGIAYIRTLDDGVKFEFLEWRRLRIG
jgi:hypothetical protein